MKLQVNDQLSLYYEVKGSGLPLVLLHGFTGTHQTWAPFDAWGEDYQLILVDIVGHGESQVLTDKPSIHLFTMDMMASALSQLLTHLNVQQAVILGYSMGGRFALYYAIHHPERVIAMILESSSPGLLDEKERVARRKRDEGLAEQILSDGLLSFVNQWEEIPLFASQKKLPVSIREKVRQERLSQTKEGLAGSLKGMGTGHQPSLWGLLREFKAPVFLIAGEWDDKFVAIARRMEAEFPNSRLWVVPDAGHAVHVEQFDFFVRIVKDVIYPALKCSNTPTSGTR